jgi:hypothetical protein
MHPAPCDSTHVALCLLGGYVCLNPEPKHQPTRTNHALPAPCHSAARGMLALLKLQRCHLNQN